MKLGVSPSSLASLETPALALFFAHGATTPTGLAAEADRLAGGAISQLLTGGDFRAKAGETLVLHTPKLGFKRLLLVGLGKPAELPAEALRNACGTAARAVRELRQDAFTLALPAPGDLPAKPGAAVPTTRVAAQAAAEGAALALYHMADYRTRERDEHHEVGAVDLIAPAGYAAGELDDALAKVRVLERAVAFARTLIQHPGNVLTPARLAEEAQAMGREVGVEVKVLDEAALAAKGLRTLLAVGQGSELPSCLIEASWRGGKPTDAPIVFVGKGITFDTGGIGIKPGPGMEKMKYDMAGAAAVLAAVRAAAELKLPVNLVAVVPAAENMPSATAMRPGDVVTSYGGLTIEINDTDAEGRLVLADALTYAVRDLGAAAIIDMATLTGAVGVALGRDVMGVMGNHPALVAGVIAAGDRAGERGWELPLFDAYDELLESHIADLKNYGGRYAGTIAAAAFLAKFVGETPWVHLDIAGVAWSDADKGYRPKGPTGSPIRLLLELLADWPKP